jgi:AraC-like DNA-binding protein
MTIPYRSGESSSGSPDFNAQSGSHEFVAAALTTALRREVIPKHPQHSIRTLTHDFPSEICGWNAHPEYEIHLITKTHGSFIAGDHVGTFSPGHVSILGPNLPHDWVSDLGPAEVAVDRDAVIQFSDDWIRGCMELIPELQEVDKLLKLSSRGIVFSGATAWGAAEAILAVVTSRGAVQVSHLFSLLGLLAEAPTDERHVVASEWLGRPTDASARSAVEVGMSYIFSNLNGHIRLTTAANMAFMSEPTFSKYFKRATGLTFSYMVKKLRIAQACRLLDSTEHPIAKVAALSGYNNVANFNRQFLSEVGTTPTMYRRMETSQKPPAELPSLNRRATAERE